MSEPTFSKWSALKVILRMVQDSAAMAPSDQKDALAPIIRQAQEALNELESSLPAPVVAEVRRAPIDLKGIRQREQAATSGPWKCWNGWGEQSDGSIRCERIGTTDPDAWRGIRPNNFECPDLWGMKADFEFIAHARQDIPDLLAEVERLRQRVHELEGEK